MSTCRTPPTPTEAHRRTAAQPCAHPCQCLMRSLHSSSKVGRFPVLLDTRLISPVDDNAGVTDAIPPVQAARARAETNEHGAPRPPSGNGAGGLPMMFTRKLPMTPIMRPEYRYCHKDGFVKPLRAHHCRACGTVRELNAKACGARMLIMADSVF